MMKESTNLYITRRFLGLPDNGFRYCQNKRGMKTMEWPPAKDKPEVQRARIVALAKEIYPNGTVVFDEKQPRSFIRFRIDDTQTGTILTSAYPEYLSSELADKSDDQLRALLRAVGPQFAKRDEK